MRRDIRGISRDDRFLDAAYKGSVPDLKGAIKRLDPNEPKRYGCMALHIVSRLGHVGAVETLLDHDVDITARTENSHTSLRKTALRIAVENLHLEIVELLLKKGAPTDPSDNDISSILDLAKQKMESPGLSPEDKDTISKIYNLLEHPPLAEGPLGKYHLLGDNEFVPMPRKGPSPRAPISKKYRKIDDPDLPPKPHGSEACKKHRITVADFFVRDRPDQTGDISQGMEYRNIKSYSVHAVLYKKGLESRPDMKARSQNLDKIRSQFTWYHVPANNVSLLRS